MTRGTGIHTGFSVVILRTANQWLRAASISPCAVPYWALRVSNHTHVHVCAHQEYI